MMPDFRKLLNRIIEDVRTRQSLDQFTEDELHSVLDATIRMLKPLPVLIDVDVPVTIFGDIHGHLSDLRTFLARVSHHPSSSRLLFLGDYADRGAKGLEVLFLLFSLKLLYPKRVDMLRGNHETAPVNEW